MKQKVVFLGGFGRSGTTLLERLLGTDDDMVPLGEVVHLWQRSLRDDELCGCGQPFSACPFWTRVGEVAFGGWRTVDADRMIDLQLGVDKSRHLPKLVSGLGGRRWRAELEEYVDHYRRLYAAAATVSGAPVVVDSSKQASLPYCLLTSPALDVRVLHCIRDSRAVAHSWSREVRRPESSSDDHTEMTRYSWGPSSFYWLLHNLEVDMLRLWSDPPLRVWYEEWLSEPRQLLDRVRAHAGLAPTTGDAVRDASVELTPAHTCSGNPMRFATGTMRLRLDDRWHREMTPAERRKVTSLTWPLLLRYGYLGRSRRV